MNLVIYCEDRPRAHWVVLKQIDYVPQVPLDGHREPQTYYTRFAECSSYEDALAIVKSMSVTHLI